MYRIVCFLLCTLLITTCKTSQKTVQVKDNPKAPFSWDNATVYFMLTDRFYNGDKSNDFKYPKEAKPASYRGFMGGDVKGITTKIKEGYFDSLGVNAIWMTPLFENIIGSVDEGTGTSYGFHGYWIRDWTSFDKRIGTVEDIKEMVQTAHQHGIRVLFDVIANHTGPVTATDSQWPEDWVRTKPQCEYKDFASTVTCTLVKNLPDIKTESEKEVDLPKFLKEKWKSEGRYEQELKELNDFFATTKLKRTPRNYIIKWLVDLIKEFGVDGFRVDTAKHTEAGVWKVLFEEAQKAFDLWKKNNPDAVLDDSVFYMVGEVYNYFIGNGRMYDFGDKKVDFFDNGFHSLINFDFKGDANKSYGELFHKYDSLLHHELLGKTVLNYISSHDDGGPFDKERKRCIEAGTKLLLTQGGAQIYYGDETGRSLSVQAEGDAVLRSFMNWDELHIIEKKEILNHWRKLGTFRKNHIAVGAGYHKDLQHTPYVFARNYNLKNIQDDVVIALDVKEKSTINVSSLCDDCVVIDHYTSKAYKAKNGTITCPKAMVILLEKKAQL